MHKESCQKKFKLFLEPDTNRSADNTLRKVSIYQTWIVFWTLAKKCSSSYTYHSLVCIWSVLKYYDRIPYGISLRFRDYVLVIFTFEIAVRQTWILPYCSQVKLNTQYLRVLKNAENPYNVHMNSDDCFVIVLWFCRSEIC